MATVQVLFPGPGPKANGLQATPEGLWVCDQEDNFVYLVSYGDGAVLTRFPGPGRNLSGITAGGGSIWPASNTRPAVVYRHDPKAGWCTAALVLPKPYEGGIHGLEYHDGSLWVTRPGLLSIQQISAETGELVSEIPFPARRSHGIFWHEGKLTCVETNGGVVYTLDPSTGTILDRFTVEGFEMHGMTRADDGTIWVCDAMTNRIGVLHA
ncbi:MAG: hypothetical protein HYY04_17890 [Chloroflexi bacterium]|nr:hypothetical protein [Chloroflexota bacterium]